MTSKKKSFKGTNPALQFISTDNTDIESKTSETFFTEQTSSTDIQSEPDTMSYTDVESKTLKTSKTDHKELKSRRVNWMLKPSIHSDFEKIATMKRTSVNDLVNQLLEEYILREAKTIEKYNATFTV
jgi:predicted HicB family RNase H-like nuclease